jgi:hypothetical protein
MKIGNNTIETCNQYPHLIGPVKILHQAIKDGVAILVRLINL